jgi:exonuclease SbcD
VEILDEFLVQLARRNLQVFLISGNHDSPERLAFASRLIAST